ncbi:hypothetical protein [Amycolatopsis sp. NPDC004378]
MNLRRVNAALALALLVLAFALFTTGNTTAGTCALASAFGAAAIAFSKGVSR